MEELKELSRSIKLYSELGRELLNIEGSVGTRYREMLGSTNAIILNINKLINEINAEIFKLTSKTEGLYLKDLTRIDAEFIALKYSDITGQVNLVNKGQRYPSKKLSSINEKYQNLKNSINEMIGVIDQLNSGINRLIKLQEMLKKEFENNELVNGTILYLSHNLDLF
ncbi:hypothetical protein IAI10_16565 [Clostridium sp. 19966]|uniref:hypothetical protein n=1 Tax=Clostridium sp. 19966 TaxID=2768166 RepID=UPI0028E041EE|nr:hypothetical protein [Clostridium sp. 19966]MDT8718282.1 hypothetical protein [Clostridium sp. 19966]